MRGDAASDLPKVGASTERSRRSRSLPRHLDFGEQRTRFDKAAIRRHEPLEHRHDQPTWLDRFLPCFATEDLGLDDKVSMEGNGEFDGQFDRLVVRDGAKFQLGHVNLRRVQGQDRE